MGVEPDPSVTPSSGHQDQAPIEAANALLVPAGGATSPSGRKGALGGVRLGDSSIAELTPLTTVGVRTCAWHKFGRPA